MAVCGDFAEPTPDALLDAVETATGLRLGRIMARMHAVGERGEAAARVIMHPAHSTAADLDLLRVARDCPPSSKDKSPSLRKSRES